MTEILVGFPALLVDSGHKNSAKANAVNLLNLLFLAMLDLSHITTWKKTNMQQLRGHIN